MLSGTPLPNPLDIRQPPTLSPMAFRTPRLRWRLVPWLVLALIAFAVVVVFLSARALWSVRGEGNTAQTHLNEALTALQEGRLERADSEVAEAQKAVDRAERSSGSWALSTLKPLPVVGTAVSDARGLVSALADSTAVADSGVELYPMVKGERVALVGKDGSVDLDVLDEVVQLAGGIGDHLSSAMTSLDEVEGSTPLVGGSLARARDSAQSRLEPLAEQYDEVGPVLDALPSIFGADGERRYLVAMLNPAELRYSGGAPLSLARLSVEDGQLELSNSYALNEYNARVGRVTWKGVTGNPFHPEGPTLFTNATFSPNWSQSGEEALRAWRQLVGGKLDGMIVIDLPGLARLMQVTGPVQTDGYGELNSGNLVQELAGSYDEFTDLEQERRHRLNEAIIPIFKDKLINGGKFDQKITALRDAGAARQFAVYFRDDTAQSAFDGIDLTGDLASPDRDYFGLFTQNINSSKSDVFQRRNVSSVVKIDESGQAEVTVSATLQNDSPPYLGVVPDEREGYYTRWSGSRLAIFLPTRAQLESVTVNGKSLDKKLNVRDRERFPMAWVRTDVELAPGATADLRVTYTLPDAAERTDDGLSYVLRMDPQSLAIPQNTSVTVKWPRGYGVGSMPEGWKAKGRAARFRAPLTESVGWEITALER